MNTPRPGWVFPTANGSLSQTHLNQPPPILVTLVGEPGAVGVHLGLQRLGQHPPRTLPDQFVDQ